MGRFVICWLSASSGTIAKGSGGSASSRVLSWGMSPKGGALEGDQFPGWDTTVVVPTKMQLTMVNRHTGNGNDPSPSSHSRLHART